MAAAEVSMTRLGATDPEEWGVAGRLSDALPRLACGR
jgi:hypothetical protein